MFCGSKALINFSISDFQAIRGNQVEVRYHFVRKYVRNKHFDFKHNATSDNEVENFTKPARKMN